MALDERKQYSDSIADSKDDELVLRGIVPRHFLAYRLFRALRLAGCIFIGLAIGMFALTYAEPFSVVTGESFYRYGTLFVGCLGLASLLIALLDRIAFLRKPPFDDWVFEIAQKKLGTDVIYYDSKNIYIQYDRSGKEVDKREFITEMSDKSINYSYFLVKTFIDKGVIQVECTRRQPIPNSAALNENDDLFWNIIPLGLTINNTTQSISPVGWYLNDQNKNPELLATVPSTSILIAGGTGCFEKDTYIPMYNNIKE